MSAATLSGDILSICLLFANGDIRTSLAEIIQRAEDFQEKQQRYFGISPHDFRGLLRSLVMFELGLRRIGEDIGNIRLSEIVTPMLSYHDAYFNDEGEHWCGDDNEIDDANSVLSWFGYSESEYREKQDQKRNLKAFFLEAGDGVIIPGNVRRIMKQLKIDENVLQHCSRPMV